MLFALQRNSPKVGQPPALPAMKPVKLPASYYQQFDADYTRDVPGEGYAGWKKADIELAPEHTAVVVMHAWECGTIDQWPGWRRSVEYHPRALKILAEVFPPLLSAVGASPAWPRVAKDPAFEAQDQFRRDNVFVGKRNWPDVEEGFKQLDFAPEARPVGDEPIAEDGHQLAALCHAHGINHLVYMGFAINWCLLMSPGGMVDLGRYGVMCSTIREAVTAVENAETARTEREKAQALWRVALNFGFVFGAEDFTKMVRSLARSSG